MVSQLNGDLASFLYCFEKTMDYVIEDSLVDLPVRADPEWNVVGLDNLNFYSTVLQQLAKRLDEVNDDPTCLAVFPVELWTECFEIHVVVCYLSGYNEVHEI